MGQNPLNSILDNKIIKGLTIDWNKIEQYSYLRRIPALKNLQDLKFNNLVTFFVGENGTGKSTLLEGIAIAYGFNPEGGTINFKFSNYDDSSELHNAIRLQKGINKNKFGYFLRAESFFNLASKSEEYAHSGGGGMSPPANLHFRSHGESFLDYIQTYNKTGLYIMDEPEAALSPQRQLVLIYEIVKMAESGAQFIIATHSPVLLGIPGADIISFDNGELHHCSWEETGSYIVTKAFLNNRDKMLIELFSDEYE